MMERTVGVQPIPRPEWTPHPHPGCHGVEFRVLLRLDHLVIAMLRIRPHGAIHEHSATHDADVICLEGRGMTGVGNEQAPIRAGERIRWPAHVLHRLWTEDSEMITLMIEHYPDGQADNGGQRRSDEGETRG